MTKVVEEETGVKLRGLTKDELETLAQEAGFEAFRGRQLFHWLQKKMVRDFDDMRNLPGGFREWLKENTELGGVKAAAAQRQSADGSTKFLFELEDGKKIESVLMPDPVRKYWTLCLSSQVGCAVDCKFCVTGLNGFFRQMRADEIIDQVLFARRYLLENDPEAIFRNLVFMGMGEPLLNAEAVIKTIRILTSHAGLDLSPRRITVSTSGIVPGMIELAESGVEAALALSLNAPNQELREKVMPISKKYPLEEVLEVIRSREFSRRKRVTMEYVLLTGVNDEPEHAREVARLLKDIPCKVNLIPFNPHPELPYLRPEIGRVEKFAQILRDEFYTVSVRWSKALDVEGACGQLAGEHRQRQRRYEAVSPGTIPADLDFFATVAGEDEEE